MQENLLFRSKQGIGQFPVSQKQGTGHFPVSQKQGTGQFPVLNEMPIFLCITYLTKKNCMLSFFQIISTQMDISVSFFALIQCYWLEDGSEVLENSLLIPRWKKIWIPHSRLRRSWGIHFFSPRDSEGILQYLLAIIKPLSHCIRKKNKS